MKAWPIYVVALLLTSNLAACVFFFCYQARMHRYVRILRLRLLRRDTAAGQTISGATITSDYVLLREFGHARLQRCQPMQTWLLRPQKMTVDSEIGPIWVTVERVGPNYKLTGDVASQPMHCYGATFHIACANFSDLVSARRARLSRKG